MEVPCSSLCQRLVATDRCTAAQQARAHLVLPGQCSLGLSRGGLALRQHRCPWLPFPVVQHLQLLVILGKQAGRSVTSCSTLWRGCHLQAHEHDSVFCSRAPCCPQVQQQICCSPCCQQAQQVVWLSCCLATDALLWLPCNNARLARAGAAPLGRVMRRNTCLQHLPAMPLPTGRDVAGSGLQATYAATQRAQQVQYLSYCLAPCPARASRHAAALLRLRGRLDAHPDPECSPHGWRAPSCCPAAKTWHGHSHPAGHTCTQTLHPQAAAGRGATCARASTAALGCQTESRHLQGKIGGL